jgi:hypothetical protein
MTFMARKFKFGYEYILLSPMLFILSLLATCFQAGFLLVVFLDPEDGGDIFIRNVS